MPSSPGDSACSEEIYYVCQRCGNCCRWPGEVPVDDDEIRRLARHLEIPEDLFIAHYTRVRRNRTGLALMDKPDGSCIFLDQAGDCSVNPAKPDQCRGFPNAWNFEGWQEVCEAIPVPRSRLEEAR